MTSKGQIINDGNCSHMTSISSSKRTEKKSKDGTFRPTHNSNVVVQEVKTGVGIMWSKYPQVISQPAT